MRFRNLRGLTSASSVEPRLRGPTRSNGQRRWFAKPQAAALALVALASTLGGCASVPAGKSVVSDMSAKPDASEVEFWHTLQTRALATNDDAFHGLLIYLDGNDASTDYQARVTALKQRGMLPASFNGQADEAIERGTLAVALVKALDFKGGLTMR